MRDLAGRLSFFWFVFLGGKLEGLFCPSISCWGFSGVVGEMFGGEREGKEGREGKGRE